MSLDQLWVGRAPQIHHVSRIPGTRQNRFDPRRHVRQCRRMVNVTDIEVLLPEIRAYARSICLSTIEAEDLVQDAVERALRSDTRPKDLADLRPWMFRVVRNLFYDELRKHRVRREYSTAQARLSSDGSSLPDRENDVLLRLAYEKLKPEFKEILFLVDVMGLKYIEAARVIEAPKGTVMSRVSRARKALLELVGRDDNSSAASKRV